MSEIAEVETPERRGRPPKVAIPLAPARYVMVAVFCAVTGYTDKAVRRKIADGIWVEGRQYKKAPDGHVMMDMEAYQLWVEGQTGG